MTDPIQLDGYVHLYSGKVRDLYAPVDPTTGQPVNDRLLLVASDRISAYDFALEPPIPGKGAVLTQLSRWWFERVSDLAPHHLIEGAIPAPVADRAVLARRLEMLPVECVARGYLTGGGLAEYQATGSVSGVPLPPGLRDGDALPEPIFTPSTKAEQGEHDEPISYEQVVALIGPELAAAARDLTLAIWQRGHDLARDRGIILADTKVEFGVDNGALVIADELLTPDSSRFWPADAWEPGHPQPSFDKQFVRDWLTSPESGWDRSTNTPPPVLPPQIVAQTQARYLEAYQRITGQALTG